MKKLLSVLFLAVLAAGCYNDTEEDLYPVPTTPPPPAGGDTVSFTSQVKPIFDQKCATAGCHDATGLAAGYNLSTYAGAKQAVTNNRLIGALTHASGFSPMPKGMPKLDQPSIDLVTKWVNQGAMNN